MTRMLILSVLSLSAACTGEDTDTETPFVCDEAAGTICPYAGTGDNGWNKDGRDKLETMFSFPMGINFSPYGNPAIADWNNHKIRQILPDGTVQTMMGTDFLGDGDPANLDRTPAGALGTTVNLNHPTMQEWLADGTLISASWHTHKIRTWDPATSMVNVILGGAPGMAPAEPVEDRGAPVSATGCQMNQPKEIVLDSDENVYILDMRNERIRFWDRAAATMTTVAGKGLKANLPADAPNCTVQSGNALDVCFAFPKNSNPEPGGSIVLSADETMLYIADTEAHVIRELDLTTGQLTILAGTYASHGFADGAGATAQFDFPTDLALDGTELFVADANNHLVRKIDVTTGEVSTVAGTGEPTCTDGTAGTGAADAELSIRPMVCEEQKTAGDGGPAVDATLFRPMALELDLDGNLVVADTYNHRYRVIYR